MLWKWLLNQNLNLVFWEFWAWKTMYTVKDAYEAYERWEIVISNMWLAFPHIRWYTSKWLPPIIKEIQDYHDNVATPTYAPNSYLFSNNIKKRKWKTRKFFFLIDEGSIFFNARNFKENFSDSTMIEFFVQPRKYDCTIAIICQSLKMIDINFVRLAQEVVEFRKSLFGFIRVGESYDIKYINLEGQGWDHETPIIERKRYFHLWNIQKAKTKFFWGLYYTKEILGERAVRHPKNILTLKDYLEKEEQPNFHDWKKNFAMAKKFFWLDEKEIEQDSQNAHKTDK